MAISCRLDCTYCGDGIVNGAPGAESCDDGNTNNRDSCQNSCLGRFRRDPGSIVFHGSRRPTDRLKVNGVVVTRLPMSTDGLLITVRLSNANGVIYETTLPGGSLVRSGHQLKFRDRNAPRSVAGGLALFRISPHGSDGDQVQVEAYGNLSTATLADMTIEILFDSAIYQNSATWTPTRTGWHLVDHER